MYKKQMPREVFDRIQASTTRFNAIRNIAAQVYGFVAGMFKSKKLGRQIEWVKCEKCKKNHGGTLWRVGADRFRCTPHMDEQARRDRNAFRLSRGKKVRHAV